MQMSCATAAASHTPFLSFPWIPPCGHPGQSCPTGFWRTDWCAVDTKPPFRRQWFIWKHKTVSFALLVLCNRGEKMSPVYTELSCQACSRWCNLVVTHSTLPLHVPPQTRRRTARCQCFHPVRTHAQVECEVSFSWKNSKTFAWKQSKTVETSLYL